MQLSPMKFTQTLMGFKAMQLIDAAQIQEIMAIFSREFPFGQALKVADSVHVHVKVPNVSDLPHDRILQLGTQAENEAEGYVKYTFEGGINIIFSSIPVAEDDLLPSAVPPTQPRLDHIGLDLRQENDHTRRIFDEVPAEALRAGWRHVAQGTEDKPVNCCHTQVARKHWAYSDEGRPIEIAFGALQIMEASQGCDLRPIDPAHPQAAQVPHCGPESSGAAPTAGRTYYDPEDLGHFSEMGKFAPHLMRKFFDYYTAATDQDGALTRREKALIALAVAHSKQCPYCIDSYTGKCLDSGATLEQMHEAVHVAAALSAGIDLVHGVQMQKALHARHAL